MQGAACDGFSNMEEAIQAATKRGRMAAKSRKEHEMLVEDGSVWVEKLKLLVSRKGEGKTLEEIKEQLAKAAAKVKDMKDEAKELQQTGNKAMSKASTRMWNTNSWQKEWQKGWQNPQRKDVEWLCQKVSNAFAKKGRAWANGIVQNTCDVTWIGFFPCVTSPLSIVACLQR